MGRGYTTGACYVCQFIRSVWFFIIGGVFFFFFQAEDGIRDWSVTGVQTCALPISVPVPVTGTFSKVPVPVPVRLNRHSNCRNRQRRLFWIFFPRSRCLFLCSTFFFVFWAWKGHIVYLKVKKNNKFLKWNRQQYMHSAIQFPAFIGILQALILHKKDKSAARSFVPALLQSRLWTVTTCMLASTNLTGEQCSFKKLQCKSYQILNSQHCSEHVTIITQKTKLFS